MKNLCQELYLESRNLKAFSIAKLVCLLLFLLGGVLIDGFPYVICIYSAALSLEITSSLCFSCNANRLIPETNAQFRHRIIGKSLIRTVCYAGTLILSYVLMILCCDYRRFDPQSVFLLIQIGILSLGATFLMLLNIAVPQHMQRSDAQPQKKSRIYALSAVPYLGILYLILAIILHWGKIVTIPDGLKAAVFLAEGLAAIAFFVCYLVMTVRLIRGLSTEDC